VCGDSGTRYWLLSRLRLATCPLAILVSAGDVAKGKARSQPYLLGARLLGVNPSECLVIEDAPAGILAATREG